jgi:geranylgeranyl reductase family protein
MKRVAVLGGGPAGAMAGERLAAGGLETIIIDEKLAWEKPCGGGITFKAYHQYPFLLENGATKKLVHETRLAAPKAGSANMRLSQPLIIYSRTELNRLMLERAEKAGAQIEKVRVNELERSASGWRLKTRHGAIEADYCVIATGARNPFRQVGTVFTPTDAACALGYFIPGEQDHIDIQFLPNIAGYIWIFPRCGHLSAGICGKGESSLHLRRVLERYLDERGIRWKDGEFYGHVLPSLEWPAWRRNRVAGDGWMAVGDAAGLVDPITGEGIYYAIRSGDLAAQTLLSSASAPAQKACAYRQHLTSDFWRDLEYAASFARRIFLGSFLFGSVPARMVQFTRRSQRFQWLMQDLFAGTQNYLTLKNRLMGSLNGTLQELVLGFFLNRIIPTRNQI